MRPFATPAAPDCHTDLPLADFADAFGLDVAHGAMAERGHGMFPIPSSTPGRLYLAVVMPFNKRIVPALLARVAGG